MHVHNTDHAVGERWFYANDGTIANRRNTGQTQVSLKLVGYTT